MPVPQSRLFVLTLKVEDLVGYDTESGRWDGLDLDRVKYMAWQHESGLSTGYEHIQAYLVTLKKASLKAVKDIVNCKSAHVEIARSPDAADEYCRKSETRVAGPWTYGVRDARKADWSEIAEMCRLGKRSRDIYEVMPTAVLHDRAVEKLKSLHRPEDLESMPEVHIIIGEPGKGKTTFWRKNWPDAYKVPRPHDGKWWFDGYDMDDTIVFEDVARGSISATWFNDLCGEVASKVPIKGGFTWLRPRTWVLVTNCGHWTDLFEELLSYPNGGCPLYEAVKRRISHLWVTTDTMGVLVDELSETVVRT